MLLQRKSGPARWRQRLRTQTRHLVRTIIGHTDWVRYVVPSDDGRLLASASKDQVFCPTSQFAFGALKEYVRQTARLWDPLTGEQKMELRGHDHQVEVVAFAPIASYSAIRELAGVPVRSRSVLRMCISHCVQNTDRVKKPGAYVATGSRDKTIKLWDTQSGQMLKNLVDCLSTLHRKATDVSLPGRT